ncbi:24367_t:CDS:2 [Dentiscutata erythropus]|uniref:24367_t:CDS:1 n=1 Tax=Dentiscutata erythropus TaxID=1348616 RepID=A0A9N9FMV8_9GLOM|nr:24367_t:CDS:2 [Dentiscutata erythropus]
MSLHNILPGDGAVSNSIIYGGNFFMGGNIVFGDGNSEVEIEECDDYGIKERSKNLDDDEIMDLSNENNEAQKFSELDEDMLISEKVSWELDSWYKEDSPYRFDDPEDGKLSAQERDDEYVVEKIAGHRLNKNGELEYCIKWDGWDDKDNSWELSTNVFAQKLINKYWNKLSNTKSIESEPLKQTSSSTGKVQKKKRKPKAIILSSDEEQLKKSKFSSSHATLSQVKEVSENPKPKENKKAKYKKQEEKRSKFEPNEIRSEASSDWERDIGDIESVELKNEMLVVFVAWNSGVRSMHNVEEVNQKAPQKILSTASQNQKVCEKEKM